MGLHIGELASEQLAGAFDRQGFPDIDMLAAAIVPPARIPFGVLVGHDRPLRLQDRARNDVLRRDQFDLVALAPQFGADRGKDIRIGSGQSLPKKTVGGRACTHVSLLCARGFESGTPRYSFRAQCKIGIATEFGHDGAGSEDLRAATGSGGTQDCPCDWQAATSNRLQRLHLVQAFSRLTQEPPASQDAQGRVCRSHIREHRLERH